MESDEVAERARQRALVRRGYDVISLAYRGDDGNAAVSAAEDVSRYAGWVAQADMAALHLRPASTDAVVAFYYGHKTIPRASSDLSQCETPPAASCPEEFGSA